MAKQISFLTTAASFSSSSYRIGIIEKLQIGLQLIYLLLNCSFAPLLQNREKNRKTKYTHQNKIKSNLSSLAKVVELHERLAHICDYQLK